MNENGIMVRNKVRLVTQWFNQKDGIDYDRYHLISLKPNIPKLEKLKLKKVFSSHSCTTLI